jgi:hypothetical protein
VKKKKEEEEEKVIRVKKDHPGFPICRMRVTGSRAEHQHRREGCRMHNYGEDKDRQKEVGSNSGEEESPAASAADRSGNDSWKLLD